MHLPQKTKNALEVGSPERPTLRRHADCRSPFSAIACCGRGQPLWVRPAPGLMH